MYVESVLMKLRSGKITHPRIKNTTTQCRRSTVHSKEEKYNLLPPSDDDVIKPKAENRAKQLDGMSSFSVYVILFTVFAVLVIFFIIFIYRPWRTRNNDDQAETFINDLNLLRSAFRRQDDRVWDILQTRGKAHLNNSSPLRPLVCLLAAPPDGHEVASCLALKLAGLIDPQSINKQCIIINGSKYKSWGGDKTKLELDNLLNEIFLNGLKVAIVEKLEALPPRSPLLFHSYCDDQNAPFKDVSIIFTVHLPWYPAPLDTPKENERRVESFLGSEVWKFPVYEENAVASLLSRVADTIVLLHAEDKSVLAKICSK